MASIAEMIRDYVKTHDNTVSNREVIDYIIKVKKIKTPESYIRVTLNAILIKLGGTLKPEGLSGEIEAYVKEHNNEVSNQEVIKYILEKKKIKTTELSIRVTLNRVLKELGGTLKPAGIREEIKAYVEKHKNKVSYQEVIDHILKKKKIQVTEEHIKQVLREVLAEGEGTLKPPKK